MNPTASRTAVPAITGPVTRVISPGAGLGASFTVTGPVGEEGSTLVTVPVPLTRNAGGLPTPLTFPYFFAALSGLASIAASRVSTSTDCVCTVGTTLDCQI